MARKTEPRYVTEQADFPTNLRKLMEEHGVTQKALAEVIDMRPQTVSLYIGGQSVPDINTLYKIAEYFNVSADWLIGRPGSSKEIDAKLTAAIKYTGLLEEAIKSIRSIQQISFLSNELNYFICSTEFKQLVLDLYHFRGRLKEAVKLAENPAAEQHESIEKLRSAQFMEFLATRNFDELFGRVLKEELDKSCVIKKSPDGDGFIWQQGFGGEYNG